MKCHDPPFPTLRADFWDIASSVAHLNATLCLPEGENYFYVSYAKIGSKLPTNIINVNAIKIKQALKIKGCLSKYNSEKSS